MRSYVQHYRSLAAQAMLEPGFARHNFRQQEQLLRLSLLLLASFMMLSSPLSCEIRSAEAQPNVVSEPIKNKLAAYQAILQLIDSNFIEERHVSGLFDSIFASVMSTLDPHSYYQEPDRSMQYDRYIRGESYCYGLYYEYYNGQAVILQVTPNSPASDAGLLPGDRIDVVWGQPIETMSEAELDALLSAGNTLELIVTRNAGRKRVRAKLEGRPVYAKSVEVAEMIDKITGYIYLSGFIATSYYEMKRVLEDFTALGMKKLILDLRGNSGGLMKISNQVAGLFLPFHTRLCGERHRGETEIVYDTSFMPGRFTELDLVVLVDANTASAAEIVAGILQDHDRALIVGEQTFGKGVFQRRYGLPDGGSFALTEGHFYLPSGRCIQRRYEQTTYVDDRKPLQTGDNRPHSKDTLLPWQGIFHTASGRTVFGAQGIIPDVVLKDQDTTHPLIDELWEKQAFDRFADTLLNLNAEQYKQQYKDAKEFVARYQSKSELLPLFIKLARTQGVENAGKRIESHRGEVLHYIKRWICHRLFPDSGWRRSSLMKDKLFDEAIKLVGGQLVLN
jgi:carboxyl-terminal processing protease